MTEPLRWCLHPLARLHWRRWGDDWVAYDEASGMAHRLDTLRATTLLLLDESAADQAQLTQEIDAELQTGDPARLAALMGPVLAELEGARLIQHARATDEAG